MANETKEAQVNKIGLKIVGTLINAGLKMGQTIFKNNSKVWFPAVDIQNICAENGYNIPLAQADLNYYTTTIENWKLVSEGLLVDRFKYLADIFDCDNYAYLYSALEKTILGLNTCGVANGVVYNNATGKVINPHVFNVIITSDRKLWLYEPQNGQYVLIKKGQPIIEPVANWRYTIEKIYFG